MSGHSYRNGPSHIATFFADDHLSSELFATSGSTQRRKGAGLREENAVNTTFFRAMADTLVFLNTSFGYCKRVIIDENERFWFRRIYFAQTFIDDDKYIQSAILFAGGCKMCKI